MATKTAVPASWVDEVVWVDPENVTPPHEVRNPAKYNALVAAMRDTGWCGRPILAEEEIYGDYDIWDPEQLEDVDMRAWTGSHRIAAAREAEIEIPVYVMDEDTNAQVGTWESYLDDEDRVEAFRRAKDRNAAALMAAEVGFDECCIE